MKRGRSGSIMVRAPTRRTADTECQQHQWPDTAHRRTDGGQRTRDQRAFPGELHPHSHLLSLIA